MEKYDDTDKLVHVLSQYLARVSKSYLTPLDDDSHTNLGFDGLGNRLNSNWINTGDRKFILSLNLNSLALEWRNESLIVIGSIEVAGRKISEVEDDLVKSLQENGMNPDILVSKMHYDIPDYFPGNDYYDMPDIQGLKKWIFYRTIANESCAMVLSYLQQNSEIRVWPHHFDTGIYTVAGNGTGIGFGLAMSDGIVGSPYFYTSGYPSVGEINYKDLPVLESGTWITDEGWKGAVLPLTELDRLPIVGLFKIVNNFLLHSLNWYLRATTNN